MGLGELLGDGLHALIPFRIGELVYGIVGAGRGASCSEVYLMLLA